jgi:hypothetical protein
MAIRMRLHFFHSQAGLQPASEWIPGHRRREQTASGNEELAPGRRWSSVSPARLRPRRRKPDREPAASRVPFAVGRGGLEPPTDGL